MVWAGMGIPHRLIDELPVLPHNYFWTDDSRSLGNDSSPSGLGLGDGLQEEGRGQQVLEVRVLSVGSGDVGQEDGLYKLAWPALRVCLGTYLDDTTSSPHGGDTGVVEGPVVGLGSLSHEHEALGVRDDLRGVKGLLKVAANVS